MTLLRPRRMSKVSVTGSRRVLSDVVETVHDQRLLHVTEYDDSWEGFAPGDPADDAEEAAEQLVTVRALESILGVDPEDAGPRRVLSDEEVETELADVRDRVNELDDQRDAIEDRLAEVEESLDAVEPFVALGIDLDLLSGYDSLQVAVGEGRPDGIERAVVDADDLREFEMYAEDGVVAVFARPTPDAEVGALSDALVGTEFSALEVPDASGDPAQYVSDLESERASLRGDLEAVEADLDAFREQVGGFLLAAEEHLSVQVQKAEAPLSFATTANAFVAEGWIPSDEYTAFKRDLTEAVDDRVEVEELERASFGSDGTEIHREELPGDGDAGAGKPAAADGGDRQARADGGTAASAGTVVMRDDSPPVVQNNPGSVGYFETLVKAVGRPGYTELDPTIILFLTFPAFFGFMIGDLGYGVLYTAIGWYMYQNLDSPALKSMGGITLFAGGFTALFGVLYGELFGLHLITTYFWEGVVGLSHPPMEKGLSPSQISWAQAWLVLSLLLGIVHLNVGYVFDFYENLEFHGAKDALLESGSWILMMNGLWVWVFSLAAAGTVPDFIFTVFDGTGVAPEASGEFAHAVYHLGFNGFPAVVGYLGAAAFFIGLILLAVGDLVEIVEFLQVLVNVLSYTRIAAVLLAKAGMAFTVNLLVFGAYQENGNFHFLLGHGPEWVAAEYGGEATVIFGGLFHGGIALVLVGLVVLVLGHALVLALGVTSAGLQAVRLEYVEFFGKFFEGGGTPYSPFGTERRYTADE